MSARGFLAVGFVLASLACSLVGPQAAQSTPGALVCSYSQATGEVAVAGSEQLLLVRVSAGEVKLTRSASGVPDTPVPCVSDASGEEAVVSAAELTLLRVGCACAVQFWIDQKGGLTSEGGSGGGQPAGVNTQIEIGPASEGVRLILAQGGNRVELSTEGGVSKIGYGPLGSQAPLTNPQLTFAGQPPVGPGPLPAVQVIGQSIDSGHGSDVSGSGPGPRGSFAGSFYVRGGGGDDRITAGAKTLVADGLGGTDTLTGGPAPDALNSCGSENSTVTAGPGSDDITPGPGSDVAGGAGTDTVRLACLGAAAAKGPAGDSGRPGITLSLGVHRPQEVASGIQVTVTQLEDAIGTDGPDHLTGSSGPNRMFGLEGSDVLRGRGGPDRLDGAKGADLLSGGRGRDSLIGGGGRDTLRSADGIRDRRLSCGVGVRRGSADRLFRDAKDPPGRTCRHVHTLKVG